jgi:predicted DNA-binding transcriptional regulator AlpA
MASYSEILTDVLANLPADQLPNFIGELAKANAIALSRLSTPAQVPVRKSDELLSTAEAARRLGISKTTLYHRDFPFTLRDPLTRRLRFSANGIEAWIAKQTNRK